MPRAAGAPADMPGDPLAPHRRGLPVPGRGDIGQFGAARLGGQRTGHDAAQFQLGLHPLDADRGVLRSDAQRPGQFGTAQLSRGLLPPQGQQFTIALVQPAGGLGDLSALSGQPQTQDGEIHEFTGRVGGLRRAVQRGCRRLLLERPAPAYLVHRDRDQPGAETGGIAQPAESVECAEHGLLHHVVDVRVAVQCPADDVVDKGKIVGDQPLPGLLVPRPRILHQFRTVLVVPVHTCPRPLPVRPRRSGSCPQGDPSAPIG